MNPKPAFFIVCGDLVDAFPDKWPEIRTEQEKDFFKVFSNLNPHIPLVCVCGNHDVGKFKDFLRAHSTEALPCPCPFIEFEMFSN